MERKNRKAALITIGLLHVACGVAILLCPAIWLHVAALLIAVVGLGFELLL